MWQHHDQACLPKPFRLATAEELVKDHLQWRGRPTVPALQWTAVAVPALQWTAVAVPGLQWTAVAVPGLHGSAWTAVAVPGLQWTAVAVPGLLTITTTLASSQANYALALHVVGLPPDFCRCKFYKARSKGSGASGGEV
eukprot:366123-Chlamydomonas_euryale.AAC.6